MVHLLCWRKHLTEKDKLDGAITKVVKGKVDDHAENQECLAGGDVIK